MPDKFSTATTRTLECNNNAARRRVFVGLVYFVPIGRIQIYADLTIPWKKLPYIIQSILVQLLHPIDDDPLQPNDPPPEQAHSE
jgi:hypothetical protein